MVWGWIGDGSGMDRGWIEDESRVGNLCVVLAVGDVSGIGSKLPPPPPPLPSPPQLKFSKPPRKRESSRSIVDRVDEVWLTKKVIWIVVDLKKERLF